jgi:hypothetical protein
MFRGGLCFGRGGGRNGPFGLGRLRNASEIEVLFHGDAGLRRIMRANRTVDLTVHLRRLLEIQSIDNSFAAVFVKIGGYGLHKCAKDWVSRRPGNRPMKPNVMNEVLVRIGERGIHLRNLFRKFSDMFICSAFRRKSSHIGLKHQARLKHLPRKESMESAKDRKGAGIERRRTRGHERPCAMAAFEDAHRRKKTDAGAEARAADFELAGKLALGRETVSRFDLAAADESADMLDDLHGEVTMGS